MTSPDTTEAVAEALYDGTKRNAIPYLVDAAKAIAADRKALEEQGYAIVKVGDVPPWMERQPNSDPDGTWSYKLKSEQ
jgi:hypothetical protein